MNVSLKCPRFLGLNLLIILILAGILIDIWPIFNSKAEGTEDFLLDEGRLERLAISQGNSLLPIANPANPESRAIQKIRVVVTAYSSTPWETDSDPNLTAAGTWIREGIIANNLLPFGTKVKIPELFGDKIFVVEDRMSWKKGNYQIDIWFPSYWQALNFGAKNTYIEILEG